MAIAALDMVVGFSTDVAPYWLAFMGRSGTGKTMLAKQIYFNALKPPKLQEHRELVKPVCAVYWPELVDSLRDGEYWRIKDLSDANFVLIDDIVIDHDPSGFARDKLSDLLGRRVGKWTVLTSNIFPSRLAEIDVRIASRVIRDENVCIEVTSKDWATRK